MSDDNKRYEEEEHTIEETPQQNIEAREEAAHQTAEARQEDAMEWESPMATREVEQPETLTCLRSEDIDELQSRWNSLQIEFVDDPRASVKQADELVAEALDRIMRSFSSQRAELDKQWNNKEDCSTEDLRVSLQNYRSFLNRLLTL